MVVVKEKPIRKSFTTSTAMANEVVRIANQMGVPESSIVNFALRDWLVKYHREQKEILLGDEGFRPVVIEAIESAA